MNPSHTVSLELSKRLKEVGYPQEGEFWWVEDCNVVFGGVCSPNGKYYLSIKKGCYSNFVAPLASELMEYLPSPLICPSLGMNVYRFEIEKDGNNFLVTYPYLETFKDTNLCNALAKMTILLAEKGLVKW
jgi:hypothetical protein